GDKGILEELGIPQYDDQNARLVLHLSGAPDRILVEIIATVQTLENGPRPHFRRHRSRRRPPGDAVAVRTAVPVIAVAALHSVLAAQFKRCELGLASDVLRSNLIH